jgi:hypothetical protein
MKQKIGHWLPIAFCIGLSFICVAGFMSRSPSSWIIPFLCFLPMCFFFVAAVTSNLQREIRELRKQVTDLQAKQASSHDAA